MSSFQISPKPHSLQNGNELKEKKNLKRKLLLSKLTIYTKPITNEHNKVKKFCQHC